jgi:DNA-binding GntR family transcriptional regulator
MSSCCHKVDAVSKAVSKIGTAERLVEHVYRGLLTQIQSGALPPNVRLHQVNLAEQFGVSRTPIREALLRLEHEGFVNTLPRRGMFVRPLAGADVRQRYEMRELMEPWAARLACFRATDRQRASVETIQQEHEMRQENGPMQPSFESNREFHLRLVNACGNKLALQVLGRLWAQGPVDHQIYSVYLQQPNAGEVMVGGHRRIVDAFAAGDGDAVAELVRAHILESMQITEQGVKPTSDQTEASTPHHDKAH